MPVKEKGFKDFFTNGSLPNPQNLLPGTPCNSCKILTCDSIHGPPTQDCHLEDCNCCTDLAAIDNEISNAYQNLLDLVQKREHIIAKPHNNASIERVPVEMLSLIFRFVKETYNDDRGKSMFSQPHHSPPLLVGAVCKKWREISLQTPQIWTDIIVDLVKPADSALNMVDEWSRRAGVLPLDLTIFLDPGDYENQFLDNVPEELEDLVKALRSSVARWNNVALQTPWTFYKDLLTELEEAPQIFSFCAQVTDLIQYIYTSPIKLRHPLRPKYLCIEDISGIEIPFEWGNLVHLKIYNVRAGELLYIIRCAPNLEHCDATCLPTPSEHYPIPTTPITNRSLIHLRTQATSDIVGSLTLPSLQHLEYSIYSYSQFNSLVRFVRRSSPPLHAFILHCKFQPEDPDLPFEELPGITHLSVKCSGDDSEAEDQLDHFLWNLTSPSSKVILPCLKEFACDLPYMSRNHWLLLSCLLIQGQEVLVSSGVALDRPLSKVRIFMAYEVEFPMSKDMFLRLLAARKSGVDLDLRLSCGVDFFSMMAELFHVRL